SVRRWSSGRRLDRFLLMGVGRAGARRPVRKCQPRELGPSNARPGYQFTACKTRPPDTRRPALSETAAGLSSRTSFARRDLGVERFATPRSLAAEPLRDDARRATGQGDAASV